MDVSLDARDKGRPDGTIASDPAVARPALLAPQMRVTLLEHAFRGLRSDPPGASPAEIEVHGRLRDEVLEAAVAQFVGRCNGLARVNQFGGTLLLTEACCACGGWRITHFDGAMNPTRHDHFDVERDAIRALVLAQA